MNQSITLEKPEVKAAVRNQDLASQGQTRSIRSIPTYVHASVFASLCMAVGIIWDISWHTSIGRDGLLSPPHLAIYLGAVIAGVFSGIRVLKVSFWGSQEEKAKSIRFWKVFYGSLGAMFCIWGAFAMLTSAPFDDWWHNTYGLDVTILSPPHSVLALGIIMVQFGAMISVISLINQNHKEASPKTILIKRILFATASGILLAMIFTLASEYLGRGRMHHTLFYQISMATFPLIMISSAFASPFKWACTHMALVYTFFMAALVWILPLFPAEPLLGPIANPVTNFQAFQFPLLLLAPAIGVDLMIQKFHQVNKWLLSIALSALFLAIFMPLQWLMGDFLMSEAARGWFFGQSSWYYGANPDYPYRYAFHPYWDQTAAEFLKGIAIALGLGFISIRLGLSWGNWMRQIQR